MRRTNETMERANEFGARRARCCKLTAIKRIMATSGKHPFVVESDYNFVPQLNEFANCSNLNKVEPVMNMHNSLPRLKPLAHTFSIQRFNTKDREESSGGYLSGEEGIEFPKKESHEISID